MSNLIDLTENTEAVGNEKKLDCFLPKEMKSHLFHSRYFYPNICHLCSPSSKNSDRDQRDQIIRCDKCNMISYCGELHQNLHMGQHQDLCREVQNLLKSSGSTNLFDFMRNINDPDKRLNEKYKLISTVEQGLKRELYNDEKQMFLHPRICCVCFESDPASLVNCKFCPQVSFCKNHINHAQHNESYFCLSYKYCFDLDCRCMLDERYNICVNTKSFPFLFPNPETLQLPEDMNKLLTYIDEKAKITAIMNVFGNYFWSAIWSKLYSNVLTLVHVIKKFDFQSELIIHIIGTKNSRREDFAMHELLLHLFPQLKYLKIYIVGEELEQNDSVFGHQIGICEKCEKKGKLFTVDSVKLPYARLVELDSYFQAPDLIITYNCGESEVHMWAEFLSKMVKIQAPFVMTTSTNLRAKTEHIKMTERFGDLKGRSWIEKNPFASQRPYRDAREDGLKFENSYIGFYSLYGAKVSSPDKGTEKTSEKSSIEEQNVNSSRQSGASEDKKESKVEATGATKAQTSKSDPNFQKEKSESEVQEQKEGSNTSRKKKNKKSKTHKSSEHSVEKDKLDDSLKEIKRKLFELLQENDELKKLTPDVKAKFPEFRKSTELEALYLLEEIFVLKVCLDDNINKLLESFKTDNE